MPYIQRDDRPGFGRKGGKSFGGGAPWKKRDNDRDWAKPAMHPATCAECGSRCEVPFKPIEGRPVFCTNCFKRDERPEPRRFGGNTEPRPEPRPFAFENKRQDSDQTKDQLHAISAKLDTIIRTLNALTASSPKAVAPAAEKTAVKQQPIALDDSAKEIVEEETVKPKAKKVKKMGSKKK